MAKLLSIDGDESLVQKVKDDLEPRTELGRVFTAQFRAALHNKRTMQVGDYTLHELLIECYKARDDQTLCSEREFYDKYPQWAAMPLSIVGFKVGILVALIRESLVDVASAPFIVDPTPNPEIPDSERERILDELMSEVEALGANVVQAQKMFVEQAVANGVGANEAVNSPDFPTLPPGLVEELVRKQKGKLYQEVKAHASEQALLLQRDLYDKTAEGGYRTAIMEFADDFATYPFACIHGPYPTVKMESVWRKDKFVEEKKVTWTFERVSPFDLFWTEDSTNTQDGTAVFVRKRVGHNYLYDCLELAEDDENSGYIVEALEELIELTKDGKIPRNWTEFSGNPEYSGHDLAWTEGESVEILIRYGRFSGHDLSEMGFKGLKKTKLYETKVIMCGGKVINCRINNNPSPYKRPVFTASFENRNASIVGVGLGQRLLSLHKAYRAVMNLVMYNLGLSSEPITEVEVARISQYMPDDWIDDPVITPGLVIPANGDRVGNGSRAIKFTQIPTTTEGSLRLASYIFDLSHVISNIPAALHGQPVGSGANRTVRGLLTLQGNTLKPIQSALMNLDIGIVEPTVILLYKLLVMYEDDFEYSGDAKIVAKGAASMVQREMEKQTAMENLQILGQLGQQVNPEVLNRTMVKLLTTAGILEPGEDAIVPMPPQVQQPAPSPAPQQGVPQDPQPQS